MTTPVGRPLAGLLALAFLAGCADSHTAAADGDPDASLATEPDGRAAPPTVDAASVDPTGDAAGTTDGGPRNAPYDSGSPAPVVVTQPRLPAPCSAALPTGFCLRSDPGDFIGGGLSYDAAGPTSVTLSGGGGHLSGTLLDDDGNTSFQFDLAAKNGDMLTPGLYEPATRYPFNTAQGAGLSIDGNGRGCNTLTGKFSVEELGLDPTSGIARFSATFEQHCEGGATALRGVINYQASGHPDPTPMSSKSISLSGKIGRLTYDPATNIAYGLDATNRKIAKIELGTSAVTYTSVVQVPNDACVDAKRGRLFVVNKGSSILSEYALDGLAPVREITWAGTDSDASQTHFHIYCVPDRLYVVDAAWAPGLFTVDGLDTQSPTTTDQTAKVSSVGGLVLNAAASDLYVWEQYGWSAGSLSTSVRRFASTDLSMLDQTKLGYADGFVRDPLDAPILLDETRGLIFSRNRVFDALNLTKVVFTLPGATDTYQAASENAYALDAAHGLLATRNFIYGLDRYEVLSSTLTASADQMFFDRDGLLWFLVTSQGALQAQAIVH